MRLSFVETMRGWLRTTSGSEHPISFEVHASGGARGEFALAGVLSFPPWADEAPVRGTLAIAPARIAYRLEFSDASGATFSLVAEKHPSLLAPLRSMTRMRASLCQADGAVVAEGEMRFALADLLPFAASWLPVAQRAQRHLDVRRRHAERLLLTEGGRA